MLKSLWAGVSGIQAHQVAIDIEGNNIANVNTVGYKYNRANFADLLSQTTKLATAPQGTRGGTNDLQIGLGAKINSTTRVYQQGSIQNTDRPTDIAIQGEGFIVLTANNGSTYKYTRNGDLTFDSGGNLVDSNGLKVQGWLKNLNPKNNDSDMTSTKVDTTAPITNIIIKPGLRIPSKESSYVEIKANLNSGNKVVNKSNIFATNGTDGRIYNKDVDSKKISNRNVINEKSLGSKGVDLGRITNFNQHGYAVGSDMGVSTNQAGHAFNLRSASFNTLSASADIKKLTDAEKSKSVNGQGIIISIFDSSEPDPKLQNKYFQFRYTDGDEKKGHPPSTRIDPKTGQLKSWNPSATKPAFDPATNPTNLPGRLTDLTNVKEYKLNGGTVVKDVKVIYFRTDEELRIYLQSILRDPNQVGPTSAKVVANGGDKKTIFTWKNNINVEINNKGKFVIHHGKQDGSKPISWSIKGIEDPKTTMNEIFSKDIGSLEGIIDPSSKATSVAFKVPAHAASINIYDSLGSRHSLRFEFTKISNNTWSWRASVPEPGVLAGGYPPDQNIQRGGTISFSNNGALKSFSPPAITFTGNNGSAPNQVVQINLGRLDDFNGISHLDAPSFSQGISQDGFSGGDLLGTRIDDTGTLVGSFSNGRSFALGQLALASFTNNSGLKSSGNNLLSESSNSGAPVIGTAGTGGKGGIQSSSLELSNVDLSRSLTQLIALQRGFQANSKTITTSDTLLNTLIQLKN